MAWLLRCLSDPWYHLQSQHWGKGWVCEGSLQKLSATQKVQGQPELHDMLSQKKVGRKGEKNKERDRGRDTSKQAAKFPHAKWDYHIRQDPHSQITLLKISSVILQSNGLQVHSSPMATTCIFSSSPRNSQRRYLVTCSCHFNWLKLPNDHRTDTDTKMTSPLCSSLLTFCSSTTSTQQETSNIYLIKPQCVPPVRKEQRS